MLKCGFTRSEREKRQSERKGRDPVEGHTE